MCTTNRIVTCLLTLACCAVPAAAALPTPLSDVYSNTEGKFKVRMPGEPKHNVAKTGDGPDDVQHQYLVGASNGVYMVAYQDHPNLNSDDAEQVFAVGRDGFLQAIQGEQIEFKVIHQSGLKGREMHFRIPSKQGESRSRMFFVNHRWYHVFVMGAPEFVNSEQAREFLDSFEPIRLEDAQDTNREKLIRQLKKF